MKRQLIILSDLWGFQKSEWIKYYTELLEPHFNIIILYIRLMSISCNASYY